MNEKYTISFTTGGLYFSESVNVARLFLSFQEWQEVRRQVVMTNLLQARTLRTMMRTCNEVILRLKTLDDSELAFLIEANHQDQRQMLWVAFCRQYRFAANFATEILRENYLNLRQIVTTAEFESFFNRKSEWYAELEKAKDSTKRKLRQVLFKVMREAGFLTQNNHIIGATISLELASLLASGRKEDLLVFPIFESDLKQIIQAL